MIKVKELLPIGSIVLLKKAERKLMIIGVKQTDLENNKLYDYLAIPYPEGFISISHMFFINHDAIDEVFFEGYKDESREKFINKLDDYYNKKAGE